MKKGGVSVEEVCGVRREEKGKEEGCKRKSLKEKGF